MSRYFLANSPSSSSIDSHVFYYDVRVMLIGETPAQHPATESWTLLRALRHRIVFRYSVTLGKSLSGRSEWLHSRKARNRVASGSETSN